jgi:hypothetical protein
MLNKKNYSNNYGENFSILAHSAQQFEVQQGMQQGSGVS